MNKPIMITKQNIHEADVCGVYAVYMLSERIRKCIYVGASISVKKRLLPYFKDKPQHPTCKMVNMILDNMLRYFPKATLYAMIYKMDASELGQMEQHYMSVLNPMGNTNRNRWSIDRARPRVKTV